MASAKYTSLEYLYEYGTTFSTRYMSIPRSIQLAEFFVKRLGDILAARWERPCSVVMGWVRAHLSFAVLSRAALLCVRGSRQVPNGGAWGYLMAPLYQSMLLINSFVFVLYLVCFLFCVCPLQCDPIFVLF